MRVFFLLLAVNGVAFADAPPRLKPVWQWSVEERLTARFDPNARAARLQAARSDRDAPRIRPQGHTPEGLETSDSFTGREHPELFLPFEIFASFTRNAYCHDDQVAEVFRRDAYEKGIRMGLPPDFLTTLRRESEELIAIQRREVELSERVGTGGQQGNLMPELLRLRAEQCPLRAKTIRRLREIFGVETFDRFLYTAIAPNLYKSIVGGVQDAEELRAEERGCT